MKMFYLFLFLIAFGIGFEASSQKFSLQCNENPVPVFEQNDVPLSYGLNTYKFARITYAGSPVKVEITAEDFDFSDSDWEISPKSYRITGTKNQIQLYFSIGRTGFLVVRFSKNQDFTKRLVLFIEPPEIAPEGEFVDLIQKYGVDNSGESNETEKIQKALDENSGSSKILFFPDGLYKTFQLKIKSNSKIHLSKNARIIADASAIEPYLNSDNAGTSRFVLIKDAQNIQITGLGTFDGNGTWFRGVFDPGGSQGKGAMRVLFIVNSKNINFDGIVLKDASRWNTQITGSTDVIFRNCKMLNNPNPNKNLTNFDGWDPDASQRVLIENCFGWAGDDNIAIKCVGTGKPEIIHDVEDITVRGCVFLTKKSALKIGTETRCANIRRIVFEDNDIIEADRALAIDVKDEAVVDGVVFRNIRTEYHFPDAQKRGINIYLKKRENDQPTLGKIQNVLIENCSFAERFPSNFRIYRDDNQTTENDLQVTIKNLTVENKPIGFLNPEYFESKECNGVISFK